MITLLIVLDQQLPVGGKFVNAMCGNFEAWKIEPGHDWFEIAHGTFEPRRRRTKTDEHQAVDFTIGDRLQAHRRCVETVGHAACRRQPAAGVVGPAVVGTGKTARMATACETDSGAAVPADVGEGPDPAVLAMDNNSRLVGNVDALEIAGVGQLRYVPCQHPVAGDDPFELQRKNVRVRIKPPIQRVAGPVPCYQFFDRSHYQKLSPTPDFRCDRATDRSFREIFSRLLLKIPSHTGRIARSV